MMDPVTTLAFVGDLMLGRGISQAAASRSPDSFWGDVLPILRSVDAVIGNLESPITTHQPEWRGGWKAFRFRADPGTVDLLTAANIRAVALANNHILDRRGRGLSDTLAHLDAAGIRHAGAGRYLEEAVEPAILQLGSLRIGLIALTDNMPEFAAGPSRPGTNFVAISDVGAGLALVERLVRDLRRASVDFIVLSAHWGPNLRLTPPARFRAFARAAIDVGVDLFHGHSAHLFQGVEARAGKLILYDTGDFLDDYWIFPFVRTDRSFVFLVDLLNRRPVRLRMLPVIIDRGRLRVARWNEVAAHQRGMIKRSRLFGTPLTVKAGSLEMGVPACGGAS
jgi:poly-gamma-glutamate capsule biosynthesis protein CapA/YwtB (metallophosphatase superfamily)